MYGSACFRIGTISLLGDRVSSLELATELHASYRVLPVLHEESHEHPTCANRTTNEGGQTGLGTAKRRGFRVRSGGGNRGGKKAASDVLSIDRFADLLLGPVGKALFNHHTAPLHAFHVTQPRRLTMMLPVGGSATGPLPSAAASLWGPKKRSHLDISSVGDFSTLSLGSV